MKILWNLIIGLLASLAAIPAMAEEPATWGTLKGRFIYHGPPPKVEELVLNKDQEVCTKHNPTSEELLVNPENQGIANVVIWLEPEEGGPELFIHPDYQKSAKESVLLNNDKCRFDPHVCVLQTSQTLVIGNADPIPHAAAVFLFKNNPISVTVAPDEKVERTIPKPEKLPCQVSCPIHAWMKGWLVVQDHPYVAVTNASGEFEIKNLPAGTWTFRVWHESAGYLQSVTMNDTPQEWQGGRVPTKIDEGVQNWNEIKVAPEVFKK